MQLGLVRYREALDLQHEVAAAVAAGELPDTVLFLEHPPVITLGRRTEPGELHVPDGASFTTMAAELRRPVAVDDVWPAAVEALAEVFHLELEPMRELPPVERPVRV